MPPFAAKSFSMSTTMTALRAGSIAIGSGLALSVTISFLGSAAEAGRNAIQNCPLTNPTTMNLSAKLCMTASRSAQLGAYCSNFGNFGFIWSHGCASDVQISNCGLYKLGSSRLDAVMPCQCSVLPPNNREPHCVQKPRLLSPMASLDVL